jgi:hypothetical protein
MLCCRSSPCRLWRGFPSQCVRPCAPGGVGSHPPNNGVPSQGREQEGRWGAPRQGCVLRRIPTCNQVMSTGRLRETGRDSTHPGKRKFVHVHVCACMRIKLRRLASSRCKMSAQLRRWNLIFVTLVNQGGDRKVPRRALCETTRDCCCCD